MRQSKATTGIEPLGDAEASLLFAACLAGTKGVLIAVSGGPDSVALMGLLARWAERPRLAVATVDHGLRPQSAGEALGVKDAAQALGLPHETLTWSGPKRSQAIQEAARDARYRLLTAHAIRNGLSHIALAHHADDQAETVLMRLAAGSGITGLGGMAMISQRDGVTLARPFLSVAKSRLVATCHTLTLGFITDPSNEDLKYGRTRARNLLRRTSREGLDTERLTRFANRARRAADALSATAAGVLEAASLHRTDCVALANWSVIAGYPAEIRLRALIAMVSREGETQAHIRLERFETLLDAIDAAHGVGKRIKRSIGTSIVTLQADGILIAAAAPLRRRGKGVPA